MPFDGNKWSQNTFIGYLEILQNLKEKGINLVRESKEGEDPHGKCEYYFPFCYLFFYLFFKLFYSSFFCFI